MVGRNLLKSYSVNSFVFIFSILLTSFLVIGGCNSSNNNNNNNDDDEEFGATPPTTSACMPMESPCVSFNTLQNGAVVQCVLSQTDTCAVDLSDVVTQVAAHSQTSVDEYTVMWIEAWGGEGGFTDKATGGGEKGYAVTTSTVSDIASSNKMSTVIYYFVASNGRDGGDHCGSGGGAGTIVTFEDLTTLSSGIEPTSGFPPNGPNLLVAGGGGGGCGGNGEPGCLGGNCGENGGKGGIAIAEVGTNGLGAGDIDPANEGGCSNSINMWNTGCGGSDGTGGAWQAMQVNSNNATNGNDGIGGMGGAGGSGQDCTGPEALGFINTGSTALIFTAGQGGKGSSNTSMCDSGGGGGGGGYGGGGGGGHGDDIAISASGGGGGSVAFASTQSSDLSPTAVQDTACGGAAGCVSISFVLP